MTCNAVTNPDYDIGHLVTFGDRAEPNEEGGSGGNEEEMKIM